MKCVSCTVVLAVLAMQQHGKDTFVSQNAIVKRLSVTPSFLLSDHRPRQGRSIIVQVHVDGMSRFHVERTWAVCHQWKQANMVVEQQDNAIVCTTTRFYYSTKLLVESSKQRCMMIMMTSFSYSLDFLDSSSVSSSAGRGSGWVAPCLFFG